MSEIYLLLLSLAFPLFFVGIWAFVCLLLSVLGGWRSLAEAYAVADRPRGQILRGCSARVGWTNYRGILTFTAGSTHLHMALFVLFRLGHPALSIPWSEITVATSGGLFSQNVELRFSRVPQVRILINARTGAALAQASGGQLPVPEAGA